MTDQVKPTITIIREPIFSRMVFDSEINNFYRNHLRDRVWRLCRAQPKNVHFIKKHRRGWDGYINLFDRRNGRFPTGLVLAAVALLKEIIEEEELDYDVKVKGAQPLSILQNSYGVKYTLKDIVLYPHQVDATRALAVKGRGIAWMATNAGKTYVIAALCKLINGRSVILTHSKELMYQLAEEINRTTLFEVGLVGDGHKELDKHITVATMQTLSRISKAKDDETKALWSDFARTQDALFVDEVHHMKAKTMYELVMKIPAMWRYGFSGTPLSFEKLADLQLMAATGNIEYRITNEELIGEGYSAMPGIRMYDVPSNGMDFSMDYFKAYPNLITENDFRNGLIMKHAVQAAEQGDVVLVLVQRVNHLNILQRLIESAWNGPTVGIHGKHTTIFRGKMLEQMRSGAPGVYIVTNIFGEGVDVPAVGTLVMAAGGKSHIRVLQNVGRALRKKADVNKVTIVDFMDSGNRHLRKHSHLRREIYTEEGFKVEDIEMESSLSLPGV